MLLLLNKQFCVLVCFTIISTFSHLPGSLCHLALSLCIKLNLWLSAEANNLGLKSGLEYIRVNVAFRPRADIFKVWRSEKFHGSERLGMNPLLQENHSLSIWASSSLSEAVVEKNDLLSCRAIIWMGAHCDVNESQITLLCLGINPKILKFHFWCDKSLCSPFHRPLAVDWWKLPTSSYLITAGQGPVKRTHCGFCCHTKRPRGSVRLL